MVDDNLIHHPIAPPPAKRIFDLVIAGGLLILFSPLIAIILIAIWLEHFWRGQTRAPLFYVELRISAGRPFNFIKFNIFKPELIKQLRSREEFIQTKELEHNRGNLTTVGFAIQRVYLDELPQLLSVLKGQMTMVGPRPVNQLVYQKLINKGIYTKAIFKAGVTGQYQANKGEPGIDQDKLDRAYIEYCQNHSAWKIVWHDLKIILSTPKIMFKAQGL